MTHPYHHGALRNALLQAAEIILERDGIAALTLRAAAREAGVSHAAPAHHFGSMTGLLTELAASGFVRFRSHALAELQAAGSDVNERKQTLRRGYVGFARQSPGLFQLMFRSEQLDWSNPALSAAGAAAFELMMTADDDDGAGKSLSVLPNLANAMAEWSMMHGLSSLLIDGRFAAIADRLIPGIDIDTLIEAVLESASA